MSQSQFTASSKTHTSTIIKRLMTEKYSFGSRVREHILKMNNMASKLKPIDMGLKDEFFIHLVMFFLPKEFERLLRLNTTPSLKVGELKSSFPCAFRRRR
jgi:hypothetical protein